MASERTDSVVDSDSGNEETGAIENWVNDPSGATSDNRDGTGGTVSKNWSVFTDNVGRTVASTRSG